MTTATRPLATKPKSVQKQSEPTVRQIIEAARAVPSRAPSRGAWLLSGLSGVLLWASFTPLDWGPLGWIALVPLVLLVRLNRRTRLMYTAIYAAGFLSTLATLQWMRLGHAAMYAAWFALTVYMALYWIAFVAVSRAAVHRLGVPLYLAVPVVWVGLELTRAHLMTGFAWYFLGHTQYRWIELIQISDLVGAYGVSFLLAMTSGCLAALVPKSVLERLRLFPPGSHGSSAQPVENMSTAQAVEDKNSNTMLSRQAVAVAACTMLFALALGYGFVRRGQADFHEGPRVALIQGNFTTSVKHDPNEARRIFDRHFSLTGRAVEHQPHVIVWPETMYRAPLFVAAKGMTDADLERVAPDAPAKAWRESPAADSLKTLSKQAGAALIVGIDTFSAEQNGIRHYNSALFVRPDGGRTNRYDKLHRVVFGEYIPLQDTLPWLRKFTPFPENFGIAAGRQASVMQYKQWRFAPLICFEDTVPHLVRRMIKSANGGPHDGRPHDSGSIDCLVNLTNDGWFHGSSELDQHLITALFRSVECRVCMVRAVNTGISAVIDGDGVVVEPDVLIDDDRQAEISMRDPDTGRWHKQFNGLVVDSVPLDNRTSLYVAGGDWFASSCLFVTLLFAASPLLRRRRDPHTQPQQSAA